MVYLHMDAASFGQKAKSVRAPYNTIEEALAQAKHNFDRNVQMPLYITSEDETEILWKVEDGFSE